MGKKQISDKVRNKRKEKVKQAQNPFEVKVNKVKHVVVNKRVQSWEKGLPGVSRSKAVKKRKDTLLRELHHLKKSNSLLDKRFGEGDSSLTADEKMVQRFALEKKKQMGATDFSLDDNEEVLTHYGQSLGENLQDTIGSDSDDDEQAIKNATGDLQFGGLKRDDGSLSWKDKMKDIIADSKKMKYERQAEKEKVVETTNELDVSWKAVAPNLKTHMQLAPPKKKATSFVQLFHNLMMEQKSVGASDKLKTDEERAKEEAERLQVFEAKRLSRMRGDPEKPKLKNVSADSLNDGFVLEKKKPIVSFGGLGTDEDDETEQNENDVKDDKKVDSVKDDSDGESNDDDEDGEYDDDDDEDDDQEEYCQEGSDNYSDLVSENGEEEESTDQSKKNIGKAKDKSDANVSKEASVKSILKKRGVEKVEDMASSSELPYIFPAPGCYEELASLLRGHSAEDQTTILSRLRKFHHPSLAEGNKDKLEKILQYLLQYFGELVSCETLDNKLVNSVSNHLWEMSQMFPATSANFLQKYVVEKQKEFKECQRYAGRTSFVGIDTLLHFSLIGSLFPTSDYRHPVTTPAIAFIGQILSECCVKTINDCISGLFLCAVALEFVSLSCRYIPEVITFLHSLLVLGVDEMEGTGVKVFPPLKNNGRNDDLLQVKDTCEVSCEWSLTKMVTKTSEELDSEKIRCEAVSVCVRLLLTCVDTWAHLPHLAAVLKPVKEPLFMLPVQNYPESLMKNIQTLKSKMRESEAKKLHALQEPSMRPEPLKLFEPKVEESWSGKRKKGGSNRDVNERQRLNHKLKRETKAAIREIKRDSEVLATHQLEVMAKKDAERKRKTKDLMNSLANQEGDYKAIKRGKH